MFKKRTIFNSDLPEGLSIIDEGGGIHVSPYDTWNSELGYTGIGINSEGHSFIMAIPDDFKFNFYNPTDMSINTRKKFSVVLSESNIPGMTVARDLESAVNDFSSKENTDAILAVLATSSNPNEIDNAAVVCRNYSKGNIGKGQWDLPSAGILNLLLSYTDIVWDLSENISGHSSTNIGLAVYHSSTGSSDKAIWVMQEDRLSSGIWKDNYNYVLPVYTLK